MSAIIYTGPKNNSLGLRQFMKFVSADAIPKRVAALMKDSPAFASQFVEMNKFSKQTPPGARPAPKPKKFVKLGPPIKRK